MIVNHAADIAAARRNVTSRAIELEQATERLKLARTKAEEAIYSQALEKQRAEPQPTDAKGKPKEWPHPLGANESDRERAIMLGLEKQPAYILARSAVETAKHELEKAKTELDIATDYRRETEWRIRAKLTDVLAHRGIQPGSADGGTDGSMTTEVLDNAAADSGIYEPPF